jgi:hypothetical protein
VLVRHVAGVSSRSSSSSLCFRSHEVGLLPLCTLLWLMSLSLSGPSYSWSRSLGCRCWPSSVLSRCVLRGFVRKCGHPAVGCLVVAGVLATVLSGRFVMLPECCPGAVLPLCALGCRRSASCRCVHCRGSGRCHCQAFSTHHVRMVAGVLARFCSSPMCFEGCRCRCTVLFSLAFLWCFDPGDRVWQFKVCLCGYLYV